MSGRKSDGVSDFGKCDTQSYLPTNDTKTRCKKALDLLGDALLSPKVSPDQLKSIERELMHAIKYGEVSRVLEGSGAGRKAAALLRVWEASSRRREIQKLREEGARK